MVVPHSAQWRWLQNPSQPPPWLPAEPCSWITWSMGTWTGLALSHHETPISWSALSPFLDLCGEGSPVSQAALEKLLSNYRRRPEATQRLFWKQQGGQVPWTNEETGQHEESLEALSRPCPHELHGRAKGIPVSIEWGAKDRLVHEDQARRFANLFEKVQWAPAHREDHALFYESAGD